MVTVFNFALLVSFAIFLLPKRWKYPVNLILHLLLIASTTQWAIQAFTTEGGSYSIRYLYLERSDSIGD